MMDRRDIKDLVFTKSGFELVVTDYTMCTWIEADPKRPYLCQLYGPYADKEPHSADRRWWVNYRELEGHHSFRLMVQDCDDDEFLNGSVAEHLLQEFGVERPEGQGSYSLWQWTDGQ